MEALRADSRVCFLVDEIGPQVLWDQGCGISQIYKSVVCFGKAEFVEDALRRGAYWKEWCENIVPSSYPFSPMTDQNIKKTAVVKIVIESMTGKENMLSPLHKVLPNRSSEMG